MKRFAVLLIAVAAVGIVAHCSRNAASTVTHSDQTAAQLQAMGQ